MTRTRDSPTPDAHTALRSCLAFSRPPSPRITPDNIRKPTSPRRACLRRVVHRLSWTERRRQWAESICVRGRCLAHRPTAALTALLARGIPGTGMPAFRLDPNDTRTLVAFIRERLRREHGNRGRGRCGPGQRDLRGQGRLPELPPRRYATGRDVGPDLTDIGRTRTPAAIQRSLVDPSGSMMPINRPVRAVTRDGTVDHRPSPERGHLHRSDRDRRRTTRVAGQSPNFVNGR